MTPPKFPTMLRKMWSGQEVQDWIEANWTQNPALLKAKAQAGDTQSEALKDPYEFPRADPEKSPGWVIDPNFIAEIREIIESDELMTEFKPDIEQIETVLIALERMQKSI